MTTRRALYAGSFDPPTRGHLWLVEAGSRLFDEVVVAVGHNPEKRGFFGATERVELWQRVLADAGLASASVRVVSFAGRFTVDLARELDAGFLLRGIRGHEDLDHERIQRHVNGDLAPELQTVFLMPPRELAEVSSSFVRGLIGLAGWRSAVEPMVPTAVLAAIEEQAGHRRGDG